MSKYVIATKTKDKIKELTKPTSDINSLFIQRGKEGHAILEKDGKDYTPLYKWVEQGLYLWRPIKPKGK